MSRVFIESFGIIIWAEKLSREIRREGWEEKVGMLLEAVKVAIGDASHNIADIM